MTLKDLIQEGHRIYETNRRPWGTGFIISCEEYSVWLTKSTIFMENQFGKHEDIKRLRELTEKANGNGEEYFEPIIGILHAFAEIPPKLKSPDHYELIVSLMRNFDKFATQIRRRHSGRDSIRINDEYDVQDCIHAILKLFIDDIRPEEWTPSYAGGSARMDFLLPDEELVIETKMTRDNLKDRQLGEELLVDIAKYAQHSGCKQLISFIYDKESYIHNPRGLKKDLEQQSNGQLIVTVIICPE